MCQKIKFQVKWTALCLTEPRPIRAALLSVWHIFFTFDNYAMHFWEARAVDGFIFLIILAIAGSDLWFSIFIEWIYDALCSYHRY